jgi:hypothetical protein
MGSKKRGKLKATARWKVNGENTEVEDKFSYLVTLDNTGSLNKQKTLAKMKGYQALTATDKCKSVTLNIGSTDVRKHLKWDVSIRLCMVLRCG